MMVTEEKMRSAMPVNLGDGLALRFGREEDMEQVIDLFIKVWEREDMTVWLRDIMSGRHPNVKFSDFTIVEDTSNGRIVSFMSLISQTWSYGGIPFKCGQIESVVTDPEYRRRGLVRKQLDIIHKLSQSRGELMQVIWGVPWYYTMFGYENAMNASFGSLRNIYRHQIPELKDGEVESYILRPITANDHSFIQQVYEESLTRHKFAAVKTDEDWQFYFKGYSSGGFMSRQWLVIESTDGKRVGYLNYQDVNVKKQIVVFQLELLPGYGYLGIMPSILRRLWEIGSSIAAESSNGNDFQRVRFVLGKEHPSFAALTRDVVHSYSDTPVWYIRIPDLVSFLRHVKPALEKNLVGTVAEGYTGELKINFFRSGLRIQFESGKITDTAPWGADGFWHIPCFPDLMFLQLLCGRKRCVELMEASPDCRIDDKSAALLDALFPPFAGNLWLGN